jgi:NTP pyrophosphatase (non-canonical NTP hydrolase)
MTVEPWAVGDDDIRMLRDAGFSDQAILEASHVIGYFNHINRMADALDVDLEPEMPPHPNPGGQIGGRPETVSVSGFARQIKAIFGARDAERGIARNWMWFTEEVGELARALSHESQERREAEFADVFAWLTTLADQAGVDLAKAAWERYGAGCPRCGGTPCSCPERASHLASGGD